jgi:ATP-dependent protease ClpP protease subunit
MKIKNGESEGQSQKPKNGVPQNRQSADARPFSRWSDADFYSDKAQHIYFYNNMVDEASVAKLRSEVHEANKDLIVEGGIAVAPKPIVVHVHSPGGYIVEGLRLMSIFKESRAPICTLIEGNAASAATFLTVLAPYRVMTQQATTLLHEYSAFVWGKSQDVKGHVEMSERNFEFVKSMYLRRTRIGRAELEELLGHDLMLDAATCLDMGVVDRVIDPQVQQQQSRRAAELLPTHVILVKTNFNRVAASCDVAAGCQEFDSMLSKGGDDLKPVVFYPHRFCMDMDRGNPVYDAFLYVPRIQSLRTPCFSVLDTYMDIIDYIPSLYCTKRFMYESAMIVFFLRTTMLWGQLLNDRIKNTELFMSQLRGILKARTKLPDSVLDDIPKRGFTLSAQECLKYGLCDEIVRLA